MAASIQFIIRLSSYRSTLCSTRYRHTSVKINKYDVHSIFLNITPFSLCSRLWLLPASSWFLAWLILRPWRWRRYVRPKRRLTFNGLHGVISQQTEHFITTAVRTSNPRHLRGERGQPRRASRTAGLRAETRIPTTESRRSLERHEVSMQHTWAS
jgi:hypothetical protein